LKWAAASMKHCEWLTGHPADATLSWMGVKGREALNKANLGAPLPVTAESPG